MTDRSLRHRGQWGRELFEIGLVHLIVCVVVIMSLPLIKHLA